MDITINTLFARRPHVHPTAWTPNGTTVVQRYRNAAGEREGAIVLVYTADKESDFQYFAAACLGCTYRAASDSRRARLAEAEAAGLANTHAASCRAMNRGVPAAPDDAEAAAIVHSRLWGLRKYGTGNAHYVSLSDFHVDRVDLQRQAGFIEQTMVQLAQSEPDFLTSKPYFCGTGTQFMVQPHPPRP
ncbi:MULTISPECIES: hypothetical protein [unclassified Streptomyces]|uniref:hypothetical protein n=1 Tax=unclassified Streptomyces TaxID=2593676 RepID=UPI002DDA43E9|nr:hypothetical protein [Streptomyces sp. NBC_01766]WSC24941.1 hypothetical protein OIE60_35345 [Streptomyces sp. NBC_01766]